MLCSLIVQSAIFLRLRKGGGAITGFCSDNDVSIEDKSKASSHHPDPWRVSKQQDLVSTKLTPGRSVCLMMSWNHCTCQIFLEKQEKQEPEIDKGVEAGKL